MHRKEGKRVDVSIADGDSGGVMLIQYSDRGSSCQVSIADGDSGGVMLDLVSPIRHLLQKFQSLMAILGE